MGWISNAFCPHGDRPSLWHAAGEQRTAICQAVLQEGHELACVFFYREGVLNANQLTAPASDEFDLVRGWQSLHDEHGVALHICVAAALRRGVTDEREAQQLALPGHNLQPGFTLSGLGALAEAALTCDRMVQF